MKKIIFLDFDGVLNTEYYQGLLQFQGKQQRDEYGAIFAPGAIRQLKRIVEDTAAEIVISSSWKSLGLAKLQELWMKRNLPGRVIDITPAISDNNKGKEIAEWLSKYGIHDTRYVIIDDEEVALGSQVQYFIWTNPCEGLTEEPADIAIRILSL